MASVKELGYIGIEAADLDAWERFGTGILGMQVVERSHDVLVFRLDDRRHRIIVQRGPADDLAFSGYLVEDEAILNELVAALEARGAEITQGDANLAASRGVERIVVTYDPQGNRLELVLGLAAADTPFGPTLTGRGFFTETGGAGHLFMNSRGDREGMLEFYAALGFAISDYISQEIAPGIMLEGAFTHCNGRHHTLAFANMPFPKAIHHIMIEVNDMNDVGLAYDRVLDAKVPLEMTLGLHSNDKMFSFYVRTPSGFSIEYGWGGLLIEDEASWDVVTYERTSDWGHRPPHLVAEALS